jgi:uncharacterized protein (DUF1330 family)
LPTASEADREPLRRPRRAGRAFHPVGLARYRERVFETVEAFEGRYRLLGGLETALEGTWVPRIPVLIEFPDIARARGWYDSDRYAPLRRQRMAAADGDAVLLAGFDHRPVR